MKTITTLMTAAVLAAVAACAPMESAGGNGPMTPPASDADDGQCRAEQYQSWIGRNRSELPQPPAGQTWRVTCTTCPVTMDYRSDRLNILFDQQSGVIREVKCG